MEAGGTGEEDMSSGHSLVRFFSFSIYASFFPSFCFCLLLFVTFFFLHSELDLVWVGGGVDLLPVCSHLHLRFLRKDARDKAVQDEEAERRRQVRK